VILPGTKSTRSDLEWLHQTGWSDALRRYAAAGGHLLGICGGYQMLGQTVHDPQGVEALPGSTPGLDLLPVQTELKAPKTTTLTEFMWDGIPGRGYEIHMGQTDIADGRALLMLLRRNGQACSGGDGYMSGDGRVLGTYLHGLFDTPAITRRWLEGLGLGGLPVDAAHGPAVRDAAYDRLAEHTLHHVDMAAIFALIGTAPKGDAP
jgi:adenosylcobyric acid synthase